MTRASDGYPHPNAAVARRAPEVTGVSADCMLCRPPEDPAYRLATLERCWVALLPGFEFPGWVTVGTVKHRAGLADLEQPESTEFGLVLSAVTRVLKEVTEAERVYVVGTGELYEHAHVSLIPRRADEPTRGLDFLAMHRVADSAGSLELAARLRPGLAHALRLGVAGGVGDPAGADGLTA
jgi:diadenosine tetraphosphate (Ap4A) HIT family hydrolase